MANSEATQDLSKQRLAIWERTTSRAEAKQLPWPGHFLFRDDVDEELRRNITITDAKSLYDAMKGQVRGKEPRVAIAVGEVKQSMAALGLVARWVPHNIMLVDGFTKMISKSNLAPLVSCMRSGTYKIKAEVDEMSYRQQQKAEGKALKRLRGKKPTEDAEEEET